MRVPVQAIAQGAWRVKILVEYTHGGVPFVRWLHEECFVAAEAIRTRAMSVDPEKTAEILERIAAKKDAEAAVPSPLSFFQRPRAWLSRMPCAFMLRFLEHVETMFCAQLARFAIAQCQS